MKPNMLICISLLFMMTGCVTRVPNPGPDRRPGPPGEINHVVFIDLKDPAETTQLIWDLDALLKIPGVTSGYVGTHCDIGRESVLNDYDVGFFVAFDSEEAYRQYLDHRIHTSFIERWESRIESIRVYDIRDERRVWMVM